jgi:hypothetical protein
VGGGEKGDADYVSVYASFFPCLRKNACAEAATRPAATAGRPPIKKLLNEKCYFETCGHDLTTAPRHRGSFFDRGWTTRSVAYAGRSSSKLKIPTKFTSSKVIHLSLKHCPGGNNLEGTSET